MSCNRYAFGFTEQRHRGVEFRWWHNNRRADYDVPQVFEDFLPTGTGAYRLVVGESICFTLYIEHIFPCLRYIEYLVEFIYGRSATTRAPGRTDKAATAADRCGQVTGGSASLAVKTRTSGDWKATRGKDCECTASTTPFR